MTTQANDTSYVIHSDDEPLRLDRQAGIYGADDDLRFIRLQPADKVLDAGCGSGSAARLFSPHVPHGRVVGLDRNAGYLDYARRRSAADNTANIDYMEGDVLAMPFEDASFDVVWSKHLLQWVGQREQALREMVRVTRPGGRVVSCNFDGFCHAHDPTDAQVQQDVERWFSSAKAAFGFDSHLGRKLPNMFRAAGLKDVRFDIIPDKAFCGFGGDPERKWNWDTQWHAALPFSAKVFGSAAAAEAATARILARFNDPAVFVYTSLFYVEGVVP